MKGTDREAGTKRHGREFKLSPDEPVFTSGVVSRLLEIPVWVLKQLDREEVVRPARKKGCSRLYSHHELETLGKVWYYMKEERVNVRGVKVIMKIKGWGV